MQHGEPTCTRAQELDRLFRGVARLTSRAGERQTIGSGEDVAQALFERLCVAAVMPAVDHPGVRRWFALAAQRTAIDLARSEERRRAREHRYADPRTAAGHQLEDDLIERERAAEVRAAVARLDDKKRHAVVLAFFDGLTHQQVAAALDIPLGTAKARIRAALIELAAMPALARP